MISKSLIVNHSQNKSLFIEIDIEMELKMIFKLKIKND